MALTRVSDGMLGTNTVNVLSLGATGNGTTDDSAAIQAGLTAGGALYFPAGTYRANNLSITQNNTMIYSDANAVIKFNGTNGGTRIITINANDVIVQGITFDCNTQQPSYAMLAIDEAVARPTIRDCVFQNIYGTLTGSVVLNQKYGISISNADVDNFIIENCRFYNLRTVNDGSIVSETQGFGFVGGISLGFGPDGSSDTVSSFSSRGVIQDCNFETIRTITTGTNDALYDDGDGIRVGTDNSSNQYRVKIKGCTFRDCSKRAIKASASGISMYNINVEAGAGMISAIKTHPNTIIDGLTFHGNSSDYTANLFDCEAPVSSSYNYTNLQISNVYATYVTRVVEISPADATSVWKDVMFQNWYIDQIGDYGIRESGAGVTAPQNATMKDCTFIGNNGGTKIYGVLFNTVTGLTVVNGEVYHRAGVLRDCTIKFTDGANYTKTGISNSIILDVGSGASCSNVIVDLTGIPTSYLTASDQRLIYIHDDYTSVKNLTVISSENYNGTTYAMCDIGVGDYIAVNGITHITSSDARATFYVGFGNSATTNVSIMNAQRIGAGTAGNFFYVGGNNVDKVMFRNIDDFGAVGAAESVKNVSGTDIYVAGVLSKSSVAATAGTTTTDAVLI